MKKLILLITIICLLSIGVVFAQNSEPPKGPLQGGPPPEAIDACRDKADGDACSFKSPHGTLEGLCKSTPDGKHFACVPKGHKPGRHPQQGEM